MNIDISLTNQKLVLSSAGITKTYTISSAANGAGEQSGSEKTPRGEHIIRAKIGQGAPINSVFVGRRPTGEIYTSELDTQYPGRDWILSRILWLSGCEKGFNRLFKNDTMRRFIYIHGTNEEHKLGLACSHGCIRMANLDVIELFDRVDAGTRVVINE